ncbi:type-F conjugative transfer system secretin TraK [Paracoccus sp. 1_MG-2023]|uniref:TraK domain-containing protein n=1 Tax=unclassified Paracoccus (in: a-proteobacteria) TaxID=2688777 RepID=UPI001C08568F|nr:MULTISPECIES: type-F conjugative transfer system secretin TraK [unclassified Paracoccus (in: a-proteobacteria)]MBU2959156.1 type-F conjugative transfer system secretin TraK [Paracoccus sp. C2R09]MDO6669439.1 type-F conjugative transfer system secretin TraK [Paracoccus sp. 1_MG-2023]
MSRRILLHSAALTLLLTSAAAAQESSRIRSGSFEPAGDASCRSWSLDFEVESCERMPLPGDPGTIAQVYTLPDGSLRSLTQDPMAGQEEDPRDSMTPVETATNVLTDALGGDDDDRGEGSDDPETGSARQRTGSAISEAAAARETATGEENGASLPADIADGRDAPAADDGAAAENDQSIVEEDFVLPPVVASIPGRTEIMPMAMGHLNRIETPFKDPMVRSASAADAMTVEFDQNFVYVSVTQPVTLFIHDKGYPDPAIVVSLVPQRIAPRQVRITLPSTAMRDVERHAAAIEAKNAPSKPAASQAPRANTSGVRRAPEPRRATNTVAHLIQAYSRGELPAGFGNISLQGFEAEAFCAHSGVRFSFRQGSGIASNEYILVRGMAEANQTVDLNEQWCARHPQTLAVAFAPRTQISREHPADFYVLIRRPNAAIQSARRGGN